MEPRSGHTLRGEHQGEICQPPTAFPRTRSFVNGFTISAGKLAPAKADRSTTSDVMSETRCPQQHNGSCPEASAAAAPHVHFRTVVQQLQPMPYTLLLPYKCSPPARLPATPSRCKPWQCLGRTCGCGHGHDERRNMLTTQQLLPQLRPARVSPLQAGILSSAPSSYTPAAAVLSTPAYPDPVPHLRIRTTAVPHTLIHIPHHLPSPAPHHLWR